jgi:hypothetical protein
MLQRTDMREFRAKQQELVDRASSLICHMMVLDLLIAAKLASIHADPEPVLRRVNDRLAEYGVPITIKEITPVRKPSQSAESDTIATGVATQEGDQR